MESNWTNILTSQQYLQNFRHFQRLQDTMEAPELHKVALTLTLSK